MSTKTASKSYEHRGKRPNPCTRGRGVNRKMEARLESRLKDFAAMMNAIGGEAKVKSRKENGGYHRPGSWNQ